MASTKHECPQQTHGMIPMLIQSEACRGNNAEVLKWLENGGDINLSDMNNRTLLYIACENNNLSLLKALLKHPEVHLNQDLIGSSVTRYRHLSEFTPLTAAINRNSVECVEALLTSSSKCQVDLSKNTRHYIEVLFNNRPNRDWRIIDMLLKAGLPLQTPDIEHALQAAIKSDRPDSVKMIVEKAPLSIIDLSVLYNNDMWLAVDGEYLFEKAIQEGYFKSLKVLSLVMEKKDWKMLEALLKVLNKDTKLNISLAEGISGKKDKDVEKVLGEVKMEEDVMHGALCLAAIGGTSEEIVDMLFESREAYPQEILDFVLLLACVNGKFEFLPTLLQRASFKYNTLVQAQGLLEGRTDHLIARAIKKLVGQTLPLDKTEESHKDE